MIRLTRKAESCDYGDQTSNQIRDQIISTCKLQELRRKLLEKGQKLPLKELQDTARTSEAVRRQSKSVAVAEAGVNSVTVKSADHRKDKGKGDQKPITCYRCGNQNKTCNKCKQTGHFAASVCKTKKGQATEKNKVNFVDDYDEYASSVYSKD